MPSGIGVRGGRCFCVHLLCVLLSFSQGGCHPPPWSSKYYTLGFMLSGHQRSSHQNTQEMQNPPKEAAVWQEGLVTERTCPGYPLSLRGHAQARTGQIQRVPLDSARLSVVVAIIGWGRYPVVASPATGRRVVAQQTSQHIAAAAAVAVVAEAATVAAAVAAVAAVAVAAVALIVAVVVAAAAVVVAVVAAAAIAVAAVVAVVVVAAVAAAVVAAVAAAVEVADIAAVVAAAPMHSNNSFAEPERVGASTQTVSVHPRGIQNFLDLENFELSSLLLNLVDLLGHQGQLSAQLRKNCR